MIIILMIKGLSLECLHALCCSMWNGRVVFKMSSVERGQKVAHTPSFDAGMKLSEGEMSSGS